VATPITCSADPLEVRLCLAVDHLLLSNFEKVAPVLDTFALLGKFSAIKQKQNWNETTVKLIPSRRRNWFAGILAVAKCSWNKTLKRFSSCRRSTYANLHGWTPNPQKRFKAVLAFFGAETDLKVGRGAHVGKIFRRAPPLFWTLQVQLVVLVSAFVMVSTVWSVFIVRCYSTHGALRAYSLL